jgi:hypothetical protein
MAVFELELNPIRRARVWLDELPENAYLLASNGGPLRSSSPGAAIGVDTLNAGAVEILYPTPRWHYGLLGGSFTADNTGTFRSVVPIADPTARELSWSLAAADPSGPLVGLPDWVAEPLARALELRDPSLEVPPPSGELSITHALMTPTGASPAMFRVLAYSLLGILSELPSQLDEARLLSIIRAGIVSGFGGS